MPSGGYRKNAGKKKGFRARHTIETQEAKKLMIAEISKSIIPITRTLIRKAKQGNILAAKEAFDRSFGKSAQSVELKGGITIGKLLDSVDGL
jgi:hypothetical protein